MAIHGLGSSTGSAQLQQTLQQSQTQQPPATKPSDEAAKAQQAEQAKQAKTEQPKPVVNAQGQTTGKVINITA
jgi:hypothetical protein